MVPISELAPPKVNLTLSVIGRRADGYHELVSLVAFARDIGDTVVLTPGALPATATVTGPFASGITTKNLVAVALELIGEAAPYLKLGSVALDKRLPIAAGIGGGSADAAAVLRAVRSANPRHAATVDWLAIAARLGADVPVCVEPGPKIMRGVGDRLETVPGLPELAAVLVNPLVAVPADKTAQVFRRLAAPPLVPVAGNGTVIAPIADRADVVAQMARIGNDLLAPARAIVPEIDVVLAALRATGRCELAQLSGGGSTCFGIYRDMAAARDAAYALTRAQPTWWIAASRLS